MRLIDYFDKAVVDHPRRAFLVDESREISYLEAQRISKRIANALRRDGIRAGMKVAIYSQNSIEACLCVIGALRAGCVWVTFDGSDKPPAIARTLTTMDVEAVLYSQQLQASVEELCSDVALRACACIDGRGRLSLEGWLANVRDDFADVEYSPDDLVTVFSSGGTTGSPKGVMASHRCWELGLASLLGTVPVPAAPVEALAMPITHVGGGSALLYGMAKGFTIVVLAAFEPELLMRTIETRRATQTMLPPTAIAILLSHPRVRDFDMSSLTTVVYGGAPASTPTIVEAVDVFGPVLVTAFAQTETTAAVTMLTQRDHIDAIEKGNLKRLESCGRQLPLSWVEVMDEEGRLLPRGETGEIVVRSSHLMTGYYKAPDETREASRFGWHHTSDIGFKDDDGYVFLIDRKRDMIISRGFNVFPAEIERVIGGHPAVRECAVVGVPDKVMGEIIKAVVALRFGQSLGAHELSTYCRQRLGALMTPASFEFWDELPKSRAGKVLRRQVRAKFWHGREKQI